MSVVYQKSSQFGKKRRDSSRFDRFDFHELLSDPRLCYLDQVMPSERSGKHFCANIPCGGYPAVFCAACMTKFRVTFRTLKTWEVTPLRGKGHARFYRRPFLLPGSVPSCVVNFYYVSPIRPFMVFEKKLSLKALSLSCW